MLTVQNSMRTDCDDRVPIFLILASLDCAPTLPTHTRCHHARKAARLQSPLHRDRFSSWSCPNIELSPCYRRQRAANTNARYVVKPTSGTVSNASSIPLTQDVVHFAAITDIWSRERLHVLAPAGLNHRGE